MSTKLWQLPYPAVRSAHPLRDELACHGAVTLQRREISWALDVSVNWGNKLESERHPHAKTNESAKQFLPWPPNVTFEFCQKSSSGGGAGKLENLYRPNTSYSTWVPQL